MTYSGPIKILNCLLFALIIAPVTVSAQNENDSTVTYSADYFTGFAPNTVNDMLNRIPGINLILGGGGPGGRPGGGSGGGGNDRGLGSSAQILINGKRMAGKANEARSQLERISASQVNYIELVRGTSSNLDVQNSGQLINIVLFESLSTTSITSEANATYHEDGKIKPGGTVALSGQNGNLNYVISGLVQSGYQRTDGLEGSINGDFSPNDVIESVRFRDQTTYTLNSNISYAITDRDRIAVNALFTQNDPTSTQQRVITDHKTGRPVVSYDREAIPGESENWEIGGDYEHSFVNGSRLKMLIIANEQINNTTRERFIFKDSTGPQTKNLYLDTKSNYAERIMRSSYTRSLNAAHGVEAGVEIAQTTQDSNLKLGVLTGGGGSPDFGGLTPVPSPNANSTVEEIRYEPFLIHNWQINPRMTLESSLVSEFSEIEQSGDVNNKRDFTYLKPKFDFRFNLNNSLQLKATLEKSVSQLSFADFSRSANEQDNDQDTRAGNPGLEPEESIRFETALDYRLPNDGGVLNTRIFYYDFANKISNIDISPSPTNLQSTNGNVGQAVAYGIAVNASIRLGFINLPQALLTANVSVQDSKYEEDRFVPIGSRRFFPFDRGGYTLGFRHDVAALNMNYGFNFFTRINDNRFGYENDSRTTLAFPRRISAFVEKTGFAGLTYRLEVNNAFEEERCTDRRRYAGYLRDGVIREIEKICTSNGAEVVFKMRGTF